MDEAVRIAAEEAPMPISAAAKADAKRQAMEMLKDPGMLEGLKAMRDLTEAMGINAAKRTMKHLVNAGTSSGAERKGLVAEINKLSSIEDQGCLTVDFYNTETKAPDRLYLMLGECDAKHNMDAELAKIMPWANERTRPGVLQHMSMLVGVGRSMYAKFANTNQGLMARIKKYLPEKYGKANLLEYQIDRSNTTLFVLADYPKRVGILVKRGSDKSSKMPSATDK